VRPLQRTYFMTDVAEDATQLQNSVCSFLSAMEPEESVTFASLVYFYNGRHDVRYNGRILWNALSGIRTHDPSVRAGKDSSCLRRRGHYDRRFKTLVYLNISSHYTRN
jgi:hypothetical protein